MCPCTIKQASGHLYCLACRGGTCAQGKNDEEVLRAASALRQADTGNGDSKPKQAGAGLPRQPVKAPPTDSEEACRAGRRAAHQQASQAARYKQVCAKAW